MNLRARESVGLLIVCVACFVFTRWSFFCLVGE